MAKKNDVRSDIEKAVEDATEFENKPSQKKLQKQLQNEDVEGGLRTLGGAAAGLAAYALGRKIARKIKPKFDEEIHTLPMLLAGGGGALAGDFSGKYPAHDAQRKRRK